MKIAVISDIHGNVFALDAVLDHLSRRNVDRIVNLGDMFYGPIAPRATYELLLEYETLTIQGNQDRQLYESIPDERANSTLAYVLDELQGTPLEWLQSLPGECYLNDEVYLCHGGPGDDLLYLLENIESGQPAMRRGAEITSLLKGEQSSLVLCGHTHLPRSVTLDSGQLVVNPGSVGLPAYADELPVPHCMENFSPHASYAIVEKISHGWLVEHCRVPYDVDSAVQQCQKLQRNDWAGYLRSGRVD